MTQKNLSSIEKKLATDEQKLAQDTQKLAEISQDIKKVSKLLLSTGFGEFIKYLKSPWKIFWMNFLGGIFRGLGIIVGMTVVFALILWILSKFVDYPLIGEYVQEIQSQLINYTEQTNYKPHFKNIESLMEKNNQLLIKNLE